MLLGSHTGERIYEMYSEVMTVFGIENKISAIVTDNASNMKKAFSVSLLAEPDLQEDDDLWQDLPEEDSAVDSITTERVSCFAHSLQLAVKDGLRDRKCFSSAMSKVSKMSTLLHKKTLFKVSITAFSTSLKSLFAPDSALVFAEVTKVLLKSEVKFFTFDWLIKSEPIY